MDPAAFADVTDLANDLAEISNKSPEEITKNIFVELGQKIKNEARSLAPMRTGKLKSSIDYRVVGSSLIVGPNVPYAGYMEYGTASRGEFGGSPYTIVPKNKKFLVFEVNGKKVFTKKVVHPGVAARPYMRPAVENAMGELAEHLAERGQMMITRGPNV